MESVAGEDGAPIKCIDNSSYPFNGDTSGIS